MRLFHFASLTTIIFAAQATAAPAKNDDLKAELLRTVPRCDQVSENAARLVLAGEPADSVLAEWKSLCPDNTQVLLYELALKLAQIDENTRELTPELWTYLKVTGKDRRAGKNQPEYFKLLKRTAQDQTPQSEDARALRDYFVHGYYTFYASVGRARSGKFREFYRSEQASTGDEFSMSVALSAGAWIPTGNLARLGNHPSLGFQFMGGLGRFYAGFLMDFRFVNTPSEYSYYDPNTQLIRQTTTFFSLFFGPDFRWEFLRSEQLSVLLLASLGYDLLSHLAVPRYSGRLPSYSDSFNLNGGLGFRYYFSGEKTWYMDIEIRYHHVRYSNTFKGGDDLTGDYFTATAALGYRIALN